VPLRLPLPWRAFTLESPLPPEQVEAVIVRALRTEVVRGFTKTADGFRFLEKLGTSMRSGWLLVSCRLEGSEAQGEGTTSRLRVRMRGPLAGIAMLGASATLLPIALLITALRRPSEVDLGRVLLFALLGPVVWLWFSREYDRGARALEKRLRSALQR
jgi:hypothetical protein